jgi:hypothetical protein
LYRDLLVTFGRTVAGVRLYRDFSIILCRTATSIQVFESHCRDVAYYPAVLDRLLGRVDGRLARLGSLVVACVDIAYAVLGWMLRGLSA